MRTMIAMLAGAMLLAGCLSEEVVRQGRLPEPGAPERDRDFGKARQEACSKPNTDEYLECLARYDRGEREGGSVTTTFPKQKPLT